MAYTFLQAVNLTMKRAKLIEGSAGDLTAFTGNTLQHDVDVMIQVWNEVIRELLRAGTFAKETAQGTLTLVTDTSSYSFSSLSITDFERMVGNPVDTTNDQELTPYPGGWIALRVDRKDRADYPGLPLRWTINTTNGNLEIDTQPSSAEAGRAYVFLYEKRINLSATTDTFPFSDSVVDALVSSVTQVFLRYRQKGWDEALFRAGMANAAHLLRQSPVPDCYGLR